ncbi:MAG: glucose-1-phosphate cytidylyltransferase [Candidatus Heimdallarchaeota archaeon]|nr:glucose-1-phosphate cytidylyltransferase [Candidatus Heimdallarchaeota archaeon]
MKVLILAGGLGTRLSEETGLRPKPMVEIGEKPILWHIMKIYSTYGFNEFVILLGYKGYMIKEYFTNYFLNQNDVTIDLKNNNLEFHNRTSEDWKITLIDTGRNTMTGGRVKRAKSFIEGEQFMLTYGDGVSDVDISRLVDYHNENGKLITMTSVRPEGRFGVLNIDGNNMVESFKEKPKDEYGYINGGFFVCEPGVIDYIDDDSTIFERAPLENLAANGQLLSYKHHGFWKCMDTLHDKNSLNDMWRDNPKWKLWS